MAKLNITWYGDNHRAVLLQFPQSWVLEDLAVAAERINADLSILSHPVDIVCDLTTVTYVPSSCIPFVVKLLHNNRSPLIEHVYLIGARSVVRIAVHIILRLSDQGFTVHWLDRPEDYQPPT